jgi:uncharacterized cupredoxin-like copper-binding protein
MLEVPRMSRTIMSFVLPGILVLFLAACAGRETSPVAGTSPSAKEVFAPSGADWAQARRIDMALSNFEFSPRQITFMQNQPYVLHLENHGSGAHNFNAPEFFGTVLLRDTHSAGRDGAIEVAKGEARDIYLVPAKSGAFRLTCSHFLHATMGMTGEIVVH